MNSPTDIPKISVSHNTPGVNQHRVSIGNLEIAFSYDTPIGVRMDSESAWTMRENTFGTTTGRHMSALDGGSTEAKALRLAPEDFDEHLAGVLSHHGLRL